MSEQQAQEAQKECLCSDPALEYGLTDPGCPRHDPEAPEVGYACSLGRHRNCLSRQPLGSGCGCECHRRPFYGPESIR